MKSVNHNIIALLLGLLVLCGCEDWLDVAPSSTLKKEDLFKTQEGFQDVLHGVYMGLQENSLYGRELTFGFLDVLAQYYTNIPGTPQHRYALHQRYDYEASSVRGLIDNIWRTMYNNIANCNLLLDNIDEADPDIFTGNTYALIKGEALGLRALMHFDLLRLFAPAYSDDIKDLPAIPYADRFINARTPFSSMEVVCQRIAQDLEEARELLREIDPIGPENEITDHLTLYPRRAHFNYYAATLLLARLHLHMGNHSEALDLVNVLTTEHALSKWQPISTMAMLRKIFRLHFRSSDYNAAVTDVYFDFESAHEYFFLTVSVDRMLEIYDIGSGGSSDSRYINWFSRTDFNYVLKTFNMDGPPILRAEEIYLIGAEAAANTSPPLARFYLNTLRNFRGLENLSQSADLNQEIFNEYRKEFIGEGQLFHFYKRNAYLFIPGWGSSLGEKEYVLPIPLAEQEFNPF